jgi:hypothetical protein
VLTVDDTSNFTGSSFKVVALGRTTATNFANMIGGNLFFARATSVIIEQVTTTWRVTITWNECREQANFGAAGMVFDNFAAIGATAVATNGVSPEYVDGVKVVTQLAIVEDIVTYQAITAFEGFEPDKLCDTVGEVCVNYQSDITGQLYTILPELDWTTFVESVDNGRSMMRPFVVKYGWTYRDDCVAQSGTFTQSGFVVGINAAFDRTDVYGMRKYWYNHPDGLPEDQDQIKFLTTQPYGIKLCYASYAWLWVTNNFSETHGANYKLRAAFTVYKNGVGLGSWEVTVNDSATDGNAWYQPVNFNISPERVLDLIRPLTEFDYYEVQLFVTDASNTVLSIGTERLRYAITPCLCDTTDIYFLTPAGGYGTLVVDIIGSSVEREGTEVNLFEPCGWTFDERNSKGGRTLVNLRSYEKVQIQASTLGNTDAEREWFKQFVVSPVKFLRQTIDGIEVKRKLIIDTGTVELYSAGDTINLTCTGYLPDIPMQNPKNQ